jgi:hypothetical protein
MTIAEAFLQKLVDWRPGSGRETLTVTDEPSGWQVILTVERRETLSCLVWEMGARRTLAPAAADGTLLAASAERLAQTVSGLREGLKVVEIDLTRGEVLLRSEVPQQADGEVFYHEAVLKGLLEVVLRRYQAPTRARKRRQQIPFAVTHEVLAKLAGDLTAG